MELYTASKARENLYKLVDAVAVSHEPIHILGKRHKAVMLSEEDYRSMMETLHIVSIPGMKESIQKARKLPLKKFRKKIDWGKE